MKIEKLKLGRFFRDGNFKKFDPKLHGIEIVQKIDEIIDHLNSEGEKKPIYITNYQDRVENFGNIPKPDKLQEGELHIIKHCLDYCSHRMKKHHFCGLREMVNGTTVDDLRRKIKELLEEK